MGKEMKKICTWLLACIMVLTVLPGTDLKAEAAETITEYGVWVGDMQVTSENCSGEGWSYNSGEQTLTLNGFQCKLSKAGSGVIYADHSINLVLEGASTVENTGHSADSGWQSGIYVNAGTLTISGSGSLTAIGGTGYTSHGISVKNGNLVVESGTITATGQNAAGSSGIYASGNITIENGAVTATASTSSAGTSRGIECVGTYTQKGGNVEAVAGTATANSYGLQAGSWDISEIGTGSLDLQGMTAAYSINGNNSGEKEYAAGKRVLKSRDFNFIAPTDLIYDGQGKTASVTPKTGISCGVVTVKYYDAAGNYVTGTPTEVGTYTVKIDVAASGDDPAMTDVTDGSWTFTIAYGEVTEDMYRIDGINKAGWARNSVSIQAIDGLMGLAADKIVSSGISYDTSGEKEIYIKQNATGKVYKGTVNLVFRRDTAAPIITGLEHKKTYYNTAATFTVTDGKKEGEEQSGIAEVKATYGGKDITISPEADGTYKLTENGWYNIRAIDNAGNSSDSVDVCVYFCPGHKFGSVNYTWNRDENGNIISCTASGTCSNCNEKVTETASVTTEINRTQSCTEPEYTRYSANFTNSEFSYYEDIETKPALGHTQAADDGDCTTPVTCERCNYILVEAKAHNWSDSWEKDGSGHWHICQNEGCKEVEKSNHTPDREAATEDSDQVCTDCGWIITNKLGHIHKIHLEKVEAKEATCTEDGNQSYYKCTEDQKCFLDENAETEVYESDMKIQAVGHQAGDWIIDREATVTTEGSKHKECTVCKTILETASIKKLPSVSYPVIEGADGNYTINKDDAYTLRADGEFSKFVNVELDGKVVDGKYYTAKSGSTIITFTREYMEGLSEGQHNVKVNFTDGTAETTLTVAKKEAQKDTKDTKGTNKKTSAVPATGDNSDVMLWLILALSSAGAILWFGTRRKQRR